MKTKGKKALTIIRHAPAAGWSFSLPGTRFDYAREVGDGLRSSVITSALCWVMRAFQEAPVVIERREDEQWRAVPEHQLADLLRQPNPFYGGRVLWMATIMDLCFGEAFWLKVRDGTDQVVEVWWVPRALMVPKWPDHDPTVFISHYEYHVAGQVQMIEPRDVVHFRFGMDPLNIRRGFSQLASVMREVYIDDQAANFTASILRNLGIIGIVFSPKTGVAPKDYAENLKKYVQESFTGDKRAQAMAFNMPTDAQVMQYNLQGFDVAPIRDISEERVCAALAIPAAVIGFGTGLQQTKVGATMREMIQLAWKGSIIPMQEIVADELDRSILPDFQGNPRLFRTHFDTSKVRALWEDETQKTERIIKLAEASIIKVTQAQKELGFPVDPTQDKYLRELTKPPTPLRISGDGAEPKEPEEEEA